MRKVLSLAGAALMAAVTLVTPAEASHVGTLTGSCGPAAGMYGMTNVTDDMFPGGGDTVPGLFYRIDYQNVPGPTTIGVIVRANDELESQVAVQSFVANAPNGSFTGALTANISPAAQGGGVSFIRQANHGGNKTPGSGPGANMGRSDVTSGRRAGAFTSPQIGGGLTAQEYAFYVYTGQVMDVPRAVEETFTARRFVADEKGFIGKFSCGVSDD